MYFADSIVIDGKEHNIKSYDELEDTSISNTNNGFVSGRVGKGDMFAVCILGLIIVFILIFIIWKILNYINFRKAADKINKSSD